MITIISKAGLKKALMHPSANIDNCGNEPDKIYKCINSLRSIEDKYGSSKEIVTRYRILMKRLQKTHST